MKSKILNALTISLLIVTMGCKQQIPYTKVVEKKYELTESKLKNLQFHLVGNIVLTKSNSEGNTELDDGEILVSESQNLDKVIFREGTQGLFVKKISKDKIAISFETSDEYFLVFGSTSQKGLYKIQPESLSKKGKGKVTYGGEEYVLSKSSLTSYVTIRVKKSKKYNTNQRVAKGRKI